MLRSVGPIEFMENVIETTSIFHISYITLPMYLELPQ